MIGFYYLHENGDLIFKKNLPGMEEDFANSDLVKHYWKVDFSDRSDAWTVLVEGLASGANYDRIMELANKWNCTNEDAYNYARLLNVNLSQQLDDTWYAHKNNYKGKGDSALEALSNLCKNSGFKPSNQF